MKKKLLVLAVVATLAVGFGVAALAYYQSFWNQSKTESPPPQPLQLHMIPGSHNITGTANGSEATNIALANYEVKHYIDKGYQLYGVFQSGPVYWVGILTNEQQLPWVVGISLKVPVQFNSTDPIVVNFELTLANLTQSQKEKTLQIASSTIKQYGRNATTEDVSVRSWSQSLGNTNTFYAYPCVSFRVPQDFHEADTDVAIYVELQKGQVAQVQTNPSEPLPPAP